MRGRESFGWNGVTAGYRAFVDYEVASARAVIVCANLVTGALDQMREALPRIAAGEALPQPSVPSVTMTDAPDSVLATCEGQYELRPGSVLTVAATEGGGPPLAAFRLRAEAARAGGRGRSRSRRRRERVDFEAPRAPAHRERPKLPSLR